MYIQNRLGMTEGTETMLAQERRMDQIANNLANVDTAGYKKEDITFWEMMFTAADHRPRVGKALKLLTNHEQGSAKQTDNPLDFAISGDGFFKIQTPSGVRYTRNGNFTLNSQGQLSTFDGNLVLGEGGPIVLTDQNVQVGRDGLISANGQQINRLSLATFPDLNTLEKEGANLFRPKEGAAQEQPIETPDIKQGYLEGANVNIVSQMTEMIDLQRAYQSQQKAIQTSDEIDQQSTSRVGKLT
ncbi:MAG: flagellar basal-body rod protein FlgF [Proteobacteria bacterium]|nr:flagellar basal-body rod protein FlgF [Desulfobulbaceae bacterium]MBU4153673.1 flagellar basal-body rod protein FlgF [Pseudomonadota bacterium]